MKWPTVVISKGTKALDKIHKNSFPVVLAQKNSNRCFELNSLLATVHQAVQKNHSLPSYPRRPWNNPGISMYCTVSGERRANSCSHVTHSHMKRIQPVPPMLLTEILCMYQVMFSILGTNTYYQRLFFLNAVKLHLMQHRRPKSLSQCTNSITDAATK